MNADIMNRDFWIEEEIEFLDRFYLFLNLVFRRISLSFLYLSDFLGIFSIEAIEFHIEFVCAYQVCQIKHHSLELIELVFELEILHRIAQINRDQGMVWNSFKSSFARIKKFNCTLHSVSSAVLESIIVTHFIILLVNQVDDILLALSYVDD